MTRRTSLASLVKPPRQVRSRTLSNRILEATERVIRRDGLNFTIRDVAEEAQTSLGGIYGRFINRAELLHAVHEEILKRVEQQIMEAIRGAAVRDVMAMVEAFVGVVAQAYCAHGNALALIVSGSQASVTEHRAVQSQENVYRALCDVARSFPGQVRRPDVDLAMRVVLQIVLGTFGRWARLGPRFGENASDLAVLRQEMVDLVQAYLSAAPALSDAAGGTGRLQT